LGLNVEENKLGVSAMLLPAERRIFGNAYKPEPRRRFTTAHELGLDGTTKALEPEANVFAAELLMPERDVREKFSRSGELAELFAVSGEAMQWRLYSFELAHDRP
jgi:Zn-dependent peptidase ImmA (M78 family)